MLQFLLHIFLISGRMWHQPHGIVEEVHEEYVIWDAICNARRWGDRLSSLKPIDKSIYACCGRLSDSFLEYVCICYCTPYNTSKDATLCLVLSETVFTLHEPDRPLVLLTHFNIFSPANPMLSVPHISLSL